MCGIVGILGDDRGGALCREMSNEIRHRGPDGEGLVCLRQFNAGHRRLSIVDLSETGSQPFESASGRFLMTYNGEIYNHMSLRSKLDIPLKGSSDTEVLLEYIEKFGIDLALEDCCGMFAFALWDKKEETLLLARDRYGQKPLYYGSVKNSFVFSSELKSIIKSFRSELSLNKSALSKYFKYNYIPTPQTSFNEIKKLEPSSYILFSSNGIEIKKKRYWKIEEVSLEPKVNLDQSQIKGVVKDTLTKVIKEQMQMDVDYGAFLSGGIDSSLVTAIMQENSTSPINTFSIGFERAEFNEAPYAAEVSKRLGTNHTELILTEKEVLDAVPKMAEVYCEPFSDSSQIPTYLVSKLAKNHVKVCLTGDGGDEIFGGYNRYTMIPRLNSLFSKVPDVFKNLGAKGIKSLSPETLQNFSFGRRQFGENLHRIADLLEKNSLDEYYSYVISHWPIGEEVVLGEKISSVAELSKSMHLENEIEKMMFTDQVSYMMDDILVKTDRASMANSLELRVPFIDRRVAELAWRLPVESKVSNGTGKLILRKILDDYIPSQVFERSKVGFGVPLSDWLRKELKDWAWSLINPDKLKKEGLLNHNVVHRYWDLHQKGVSNNQYLLWDVIMFQAWKEKYY